MTSRFNIKEDYKQTLIEIIDGLLEIEKVLRRHKEPLTARSIRMNTVDNLIDEYVVAIGETPNKWQLQRLSDYILLDELTDGRKNKSSIEEYPFLSDLQMNRRTSNETSLGFAEDRMSSDKRVVAPNKHTKLVEKIRYTEE